MNDREASLVAAQVLQVLCDHVDLLLDKMPDVTVKIVEVSSSSSSRRWLLAATV